MIYAYFAGRLDGESSIKVTLKALLDFWKIICLNYGTMLEENNILKVVYPNICIIM